ncbi:MAG: hypothetical protein HQL28_07225, partial [Candidatus Omnitrophica bacterium]|nr:hypothetical protein [Candidatus Omnitrophota bacterium]
RAVTLYGRQSTSGTYGFLREHVLKADYAPTMSALQGNAEIAEAVKADKSGIGYVALAFARIPGLKPLTVTGTDGVPADPLSRDSVLAGKYNLGKADLIGTAKLAPAPVVSATSTAMKAAPSRASTDRERRLEYVRDLQELNAKLRGKKVDKASMREWIAGLSEIQARYEKAPNEVDAVVYETLPEMRNADGAVAYTRSPDDAGQIIVIPSVNIPEIGSDGAITGFRKLEIDEIETRFNVRRLPKSTGSDEPLKVRLKKAEGHGGCCIWTRMLPRLSREQEILRHISAGLVPTI